MTAPSSPWPPSSPSSSCNDATGIRRAAGLHAQLLNQLVQEIRRPQELGPTPAPLKELLGHTYLEVLVGALLGLLVALGVHYLFPAA